MSAQHFIVATAGHVDHGKSSLVKALTGTDPDRLPEEKARGITIDLGFAHLELPAATGLSAPNSQLSTLSIGIVDVPGHEDFVKNMVAGVGSIDLALFVVAADDGWMPQTEEHLQILGYVGVRHAVVAVTKIDLAAGREGEVAARAREQLHGTPFEAAPVVGVSVIDGRGIEELKSALAATLATVPPPRDIGKPRLHVDRVFTLRGIGTVVTGTLSGGVLHRNQAVVLQPSGTSARVRSLQTHNCDAQQVGPGTRTALNLPDLAAATADATGVCRGHIVTVPESGGPADAIDVLLERSARLASNKSASRPIKDGALVRVHHGSGNAPARLLLLDGGPLEVGGRALAQVRFQAPVFVLGGDRFILRDWPEQSTLGGGLVLDAGASRRAFRSAAHRAFLEQRAASPADARVWVASQLARDGAVRRTVLLLKTRFSTGEASEALARLTAEGKALVAGEWIADAAWWETLRKKASETIQAGHRANPERLGLDMAELRRTVEKLLPEPAVFDALVSDLCRAGFAQTGTAIRDASHRPALPPKLQAAGTTLRAALTAKPFEPPAKKELAPDALAQQALRFLLETGEAVEVAPELVMSAEHFTKAREAIVKFIRQRGRATASELRQFLNTNRRVIIPLLEKLDRDGVTRRDGDNRVLR
jgi:selenocysteine-specific elongation factor